METSPWLKLITVGLVLAALAVGYFLLSGKLSSNSNTKTSVLGQNVQTTPTPVAVASPSPASAYQRIANRTQGGVSTLPKTGFPVGLAVVFSASAMISGWSLRKFPH